MLVEVHEHQPTWEQPAQHVIPAKFARKILVAVQKYRLERVGTAQGDADLPDEGGPVHRAVLLEHTPRQGARILHQIERVPEPGQAVLAGNLAEIAIGGTLARRAGRQIGGIGMHKPSVHRRLALRMRCRAPGNRARLM